MVKRRQRYSFRSTAADGVYEIQTLDEAIQLMFTLKKNYKTKISDNPSPGLYIEIKEYPWYMETYGMNLAQALFETLKKYGLETVEKATASGIPVIIQAFEQEALVEFAKYSDLPLIYLMYWERAGGPSYDFDQIATFAHGVGPNKEWIVHYPGTSEDPVDLVSYSPFIREMHARGLAVHPYTL